MLGDLGGGGLALGDEALELGVERGDEGLRFVALGFEVGDFFAVAGELLLDVGVLTLVVGGGDLVLAGVALMFITWQSLSILSVLQELYRRRRVLLESKCVEPDPYHEQMQPVNWFGLLNLGFQSQTVNEPLRDGIWNFEGKPWRLLLLGDLVIPVFRTRSSQESPREPQVAKCMAYCRLVSVVYERDCPYGIILIGEHYSGFAIPNCGIFRREFHNSVVELRQLVLATGYGQETAVDYKPHKCSGCHLGRRRPASLGERIVRFGAPVPAKTDRHDTHCDCGDRFKWHPPFIDRDDDDDLDF